MRHVDISDIIDQEAVLGQRYLRVGVMGPSGSGKTNSAIRLGLGMTRITGGPLRVIDTQNGQCSDYADQYKFRLVLLKPPFAPQRFLATLNHCVSNGSRVIVVDSMSDEHEGYGGVCDMQEEAEEKLFNAACEKAERKGWQLPEREKFNQLAWKEAKAARRELVLGLPFVEAHIIFCFKAKKQSAAFAEKPRPGTPATSKKDELDGWKPIAGDKLFWDMPLRMLLLPMSKGVPSWNPVAECERTFIRRPTQFDALLQRFEGQSLCEDIGAEMAQWAMGNNAPPAPKKETPREVGARLDAAIAAATTHAELDAIATENAAMHASGRFTPQTFRTMCDKIDAKRSTLAEGA